MKSCLEIITEDFNISKAVSSYLAYEFCGLLRKPFKKWRAFKLGLINEKGEVLKTPQTKVELDALGRLENLVRKLKKLLVKYIGDNSMLNFLIAGYLLKQESVDNFPDLCNNFTEDEEQFLLALLTEIEKRGMD